MKRHPLPVLLTAAEEADLASRRDAGDLAALHELVERNIGLALSAARDRRWRSYAQGVDHHDCEAAHGSTSDRQSVALEALVEAAREYDPARGRFAPLARSIIRRALVDAAAKTTRSGVAIGKSSYQRAAVFGMGRARKQLTEGGETVTAEALGAALGVDAQTAAALDRATAPPSALDHMLPDALGLADPTPSALDQLIADEEGAALRSALQQLDLTDQGIVAAIYIDGDPVGRVARRVGLTRSEVQRRADVAMSRLRGLLSDES